MAESRVTNEDALAACADALEPFGFERRRIRFYRALQVDLIGWLTVRGNRYDPLLVNVLVSVRHAAVEKLVGQKAGREGPLSTVVQQLGHLMPEGRLAQWDFGWESHSDAHRGILERVVQIGGSFRHGQTIEDTARDLASAVHRYAVPWMNRMTNAEDMLEELTSDARYESDRLPAFLVILGRKDEAQAVLAEELQHRKHEGSPDVEEYRAFAERLLSSLDAT